MLYLDIQSHIDALMQRMDAATLAMFGTVRNLYERDLPPREAKAIHAQLTRMCVAYLESARVAPVQPCLSGAE